MKYQFEERETSTLDGSKVLPFDQLNAELFYPTKKEKMQTTTVKLMAVELAGCVLQELRDPKKATSNYLSNAEGVFSWGQTTDDEYYVCLGKMATNHPVESPFALLTGQLQQFGHMPGIHALTIGHTQFNGDFR